MRIVVAMSGGVDSSVAAALLAEQGHDVIGLSMQLYDASEKADGTRAFGSCCSLDDLHDARRVAAAIDIPHYILNFERQFNEQVVSNFVSEYAAGRTPLPCARCNSDLKFSTLLDRARGLGADAVATGHYARVERDARRPVPAQARRRPGEGSGLLPLLAHAGSACPRDLPRRRSPEGHGPRVRTPAESAGRGQARQPGDLLHPRSRLRGVHHASLARHGPVRRDCRRERHGGGPARRRVPIHHRPAEGARLVGLADGQRPSTCWRSTPPTGASSSARRRRSSARR